MSFIRRIRTGGKEIYIRELRRGMGQIQTCEDRRRKLEDN